MKIDTQTTYFTRKVVAIIFIIFYFMFLSAKPYENSQVVVETGTLRFFFFLFFWIFNQTLTMIHEAGHGVCYLIPHCPQFITALMGTVFQVGFPLLVAYYYKKRENILGFYIGLFFVGFTLTYTAWYISTAHEGLYLPAYKSFLGVDGYHDFNYILDKLHILKFNTLIAFIVKIIANLTMIYACFKMFLYSIENKK
ncbi:MAG: hypothetical protein ACK5LP_07420 [Campylobacteraceae bacterium]